VSIEDEVRDFITREAGWTGDRELLTPDYHLIDNGVLDSMGIFQLVTYLEDHLGVEIPDEELVPDNFESIAAIGRLVAGKDDAAT
jgi:acyl carrier protein